jgi:DNA-binding MarR family transcriptional regulator
LSLTAEGRAIYDDLAPRALQFANRLIASIDPSDREIFCRVLKQLMERSGAVADDIAKAGKPG